MAERNTSRFGRRLPRGIEAREGVSTGSSVIDRAHTIKTAICAASTGRIWLGQGMYFRCGAQGGVLVRAWQTEASVDLARMAGLIPAGLLEIMNEDGSMARCRTWIESARHTSCLMFDGSEFDPFPVAARTYIHRIAESMLPRGSVSSVMIAFESWYRFDETHLRMVMGEVDQCDAADSILVRGAYTLSGWGDFGSTLCDCRTRVDVR